MNDTILASPPEPAERPPPPDDPPYVPDPGAVPDHAPQEMPPIDPAPDPSGPTPVTV
jgi:hypothetical protein